jgi:hypothetical protein
LEAQKEPTNVKDTVIGRLHKSFYLHAARADTNEVVVESGDEPRR